MIKKSFFVVVCIFFFTWIVCIHKTYNVNLYDCQEEKIVFAQSNKKNKYNFIDETNIIEEENGSYESDETNIIEEENGSYESDEINYISNNNFRDEYENNESIESATYIGPFDFYKYDEYSVEINANLDTVAWIVDVDYYYFVVLSESTVSITCSSTSVFESFDFAIFTYEYGDVVNDSVSREIQQIYSDFSNENAKNYNATLQTGTYFVYLRGHQEYNSEKAIEYSLELNAELVPFEQSVTVESLLSSEYDGAIWISDYVPGDYIPLFDINKEILFEQSGVQGLDLPDYTLQIMNNITGYELYSQKSELAYINGLSGTDNMDVYINGVEVKGVHVATYYVCNNVLRYMLYLATTKLADAYDSNNQDLRRQIEKFELVHDAINNTIKIVAFIAGSQINIVTGIPYASTIFKYVSLAAINAIFKIITPKITDNLENMEIYFRLLSATLSMGVTSQYQNDYDYISSLPTTEVIYIPIYYYIYQPNYNPLLKRFVSFKATAACVEKTSYYPQLKINIGNTISCDQEFDYFNRGKIYGLTSFGEITSIDDLDVYDENFHIHNYTESYAYINTTHHYAYCRCGGRIRQGHAVAGTSKICIQCGGSVDKGFVQMSLNQNTDNEVTKILDNGVIILSKNEIELYLKGKLNVKDENEE